MNLLITQSNSLAALRNCKLKPYRTIHLDDAVIYEFWRVNSTKRSDINNKAVLKEMAMVCVDKNGIVVHYYPIDNEVQVVKSLGFDRVQEIIEAVRARDK